MSADVPPLHGNEELDPAHLGAEAGARDDVRGGDARPRAGGPGPAEAEGITPDRFRAAFRTGDPPRPLREEGGGYTESTTGPTHTGASPSKTTWGHESEGVMGVLGNALAFVWSGWRRALERYVLAMKREGRMRELGVRVATLADEGRLDAAGYDAGVRAVLCQLEQVAEAEAEPDAEAP